MFPTLKFAAMDLRKQLLKEHSRENSQVIFDHLLQNPDRFKELMEIFTQENYRLNQRSAWIVGMVGEKKGDWLIPYFSTLVQCLEKPIHNAISRNIYRSLQTIAVPEEFEGRVYDLALRDLSNTQSATAIKVFAMTVAFNISKSHIELQEELAWAIEEQLPYSSVGYASRARKTLKAIAKGKNRK